MLYNDAPPELKYPSKYGHTKGTILCVLFKRLETVKLVNLGLGTGDWKFKIWDCVIVINEYEFSSQAPVQTKSAF